MLSTSLPLDTFWNKLCQKAQNCDKDFELKKINMADLLELLGDGHCAYTGKEFNSIQDITFERINPKLGYVKGNVLLVNRDSNQHKSMLDAFIHRNAIPDEMKIKLLRKALYQLEKANGNKTHTP